MQAARKSIMSQLGALTAQQRADLAHLVNQGIDPKVARAIVQGYADVRKADKAERPGYHEAYVKAAKDHLPDWQHKQIHQAARASAGGHATAVARQAPDPKTAALQEIELLNHRIGHLQAEVSKQSLLASEAHVPVPDKRLVIKSGLEHAYIEQALALVLKKGDWDESAHPRSADGRFGSGPSGNKTASGKRVRAGLSGGDESYAGFSAQDHKDAAKIHQEHAANLKQRQDAALAQGDAGKAARAATALARVNLRSAQHNERATQIDSHSAARPPLAAPPASAPQPSSPGPQAQRTDRALTQHEKDTVEAYTNTTAKGAGSFYQINRTLQGTSTLGEAKQKEALANAAVLNKAIEASPLPADTTLYRGMPFMHGLSAGQVLDSPSLLSFSADKDVASKFARGAKEYSSRSSKEYGRQMVLQLAAPKGMGALDVNKKASSDHSAEAEYLVGSHQKFRVVGVKIESTQGEEVGSWGARERHVVTIEPVNS